MQARGTEVDLAPIDDALAIQSRLNAAKRKY